MEEAGKAVHEKNSERILELTDSPVYKKDTKLGDTVRSFLKIPDRLKQTPKLKRIRSILFITSK
ncbi:hypothetical protein [Leptospira kmetyi]|uniref:Uncharacterized protein n=1 Tax=Leptospira kmetyi TaxID=408139 RepID=A0ABX4NIF8_9LEPT|nr:hypothetical protein [Leptospira kmetyi]PJZ31310.1 hypothetical protein CH378_03685 [Leptospira kmetyi]